MRGKIDFVERALQLAVGLAELVRREPGQISGTTTPKALDDPTDTKASPITTRHATRNSPLRHTTQTTT
jgi:hypothetical protein